MGLYFMFKKIMVVDIWFWVLGSGFWVLGSGFWVLGGMPVFVIPGQFIIDA